MIYIIEQYADEQGKYIEIVYIFREARICNGWKYPDDSQVYVDICV